MSSVAFHSGNKTENTVYLAFGVVVSLALIRYFSPQTFDDFTTLLGFAAFWAPIIASLLFFLRVDRFLTFSLKIYSNRKYGTDAQCNILIYEFSIFHWLYSMSSEWEQPEEKYEVSLNRLVEGIDVREDIWALKGWFYFLFSLPLLSYAFGITSLDLIVVLALIEVIVFAVAFYNYSGFVKRCANIALFRTLAEAKSIMQTRTKGTNTDPTSINSEILDATIDELNSMIEKRDWLGFERRFLALLDDFSNNLELKSKWFVRYYVETWARCFSTWAGGEPTLWLLRTKVFRSMITQGLSLDLFKIDINLSLLLNVSNDKLSSEDMFFESIDKIGIENASIEYVFQAIYRLTDRATKVTNEKIVKIVLKWYQNGTTRFEELLVSLAEKVSEDLSLEIIATLLKNFSNPQIWGKIGEKSVELLIHSPENHETKSKALIQVLRNGNDEVRKIVLHESDVLDLELAKTALGFLSSSNPNLVLSAKHFFNKNAIASGGLFDIIILLASDPETGVRIGSIKLSRIFLRNRIFTDFHLQRVMKALEDSEGGVRKEALKVIIDFSELILYTDSVIALFEITKKADPDMGNRRLAAMILDKHDIVKNISIEEYEKNH